ncbi:MAG TPA: hypothetical protein VEI95_06600 [Acidobacteriota bacterium]|nr:hypothetical protein [Acidobacteriota bacterium]
MRLRRSYHSTRLVVVTMTLAMMFSTCGGSRDETISGVAIPVPSALKKGPDKPSEISILGFGAGQASFHGNMDPDKVVEFYKKELPARGWQTNMNLRSGATMLGFSKDGKSVMIAISKQSDETVLTLTVGGVGR